MEVEIKGAGRWTAGELDWPPGGFPKSVWFLRRRQAAIDLLIAPWVFQFQLDRQGLREMFPLANQRLWLGPMMGPRRSRRGPGGPGSGPGRQRDLQAPKERPPGIPHRSGIGSHGRRERLSLRREPYDH